MTKRSEPPPPHERGQRLGRGLEALLGSLPQALPQPAEASSPLRNSAEPLSIPIASITPNPAQPRRDFKESDLSEMPRASLHMGCPALLVRPTSQWVRARRSEWRRCARCQARLGIDPAVVRQIVTSRAAYVALVENLQTIRSQSIEEAEGYQRLVEEFRLTQQQIARGCRERSLDHR